jgi:putative salt-induced outer membrane protein YdiY
MAATLVAGGARAQQASIGSADGPWSGTAEISLVATSGNSDTRTFGLGGDVTYNPGAWKWLGRLTYVETEADDQLKARSQSALLETSRGFSERLEVYGRGGYLRDLFAGIERRITTEAGLAYRLVALAPHSLQLLAGFGFTDEQRAAGGDLSLTTANATGRYRWAITETSALTEEATLVADLNTGDDWRFSNEIAATAALSTRLSLKVSHKLSYLNEPVPGFGKADAILSAALVANF